MGAILSCVVLDGRISKSSVHKEFWHLHYAAPQPETPYDGTWRLLDGLNEVEIIFDNLDVASHYIIEHSEKWSLGLMMKVRHLRINPADEWHSCVSWYDENDDFVESSTIPEAAIPRDKNGCFWLFGGLLAC